MKVLTAAPYVCRGVEVGFCDCEPGELVRVGETDECFCRRYEEEEPDDDVCECHLDRDESPPFVGLATLAGTTTALVEERDLAEEQLRAAVAGSLDREGWLTPALSEDVLGVLVDLEVARIHQTASSYPAGTLISALNGRPFRVDEPATGAPIRRRR
jgi:hypothetical protein